MRGVKVEAHALGEMLHYGFEVLEALEAGCEPVLQRDLDPALLQSIRDHEGRYDTPCKTGKSDS